MSRRRSTREHRCPNCRINKLWCFCEHLLPLDSRNFLTVVMHKKETKLTSNTASLALKMLSNSELLIRGERDKKFEFTAREGFQPLYLYPSEDSEALTPEYAASFGKPIQLVVPDGTWSQARKFHKREPSLNSIPRVRVEGNLEKIYTLRKSPVEGGVCTLEAMALAYGALGEEEVKKELLNALSVMNQRVEISRDPKLWAEK